MKNYIDLMAWNMFSSNWGEQKKKRAVADLQQIYCKHSSAATCSVDLPHTFKHCLFWY